MGRCGDKNVVMAMIRFYGIGRVEHRVVSSGASTFDFIVDILAARRYIERVQRSELFLSFLVD